MTDNNKFLNVLSCPFCGSDVVSMCVYNYDAYNNISDKVESDAIIISGSIGCEKCNAVIEIENISDTDIARDILISAWNKRTPITETPKNIIPDINKIKEQTEKSCCEPAMSYIEDISRCIEENAKEGKSNLKYVISKAPTNLSDHIFRQTIAQPIIKKFTEAGYKIYGKLNDPFTALFMIHW